MVRFKGAQFAKEVKRVVRPRRGFTSCKTAQRPLAGIVLIHVLRKGQLAAEERA